MKVGISPQGHSPWPCSSGWLCWRPGVHPRLCHQCFMESLCIWLRLLCDPLLWPWDAMKIKPMLSGGPSSTQWAMKHLPWSGRVLLVPQTAPLWLWMCSGLWQDCAESLSGGCFSLLNYRFSSVLLSLGRLLRYWGLWVQSQLVTGRWHVVWDREEQGQCHGCTKVLGKCSRRLCVQVRLRVSKLHQHHWGSQYWNRSSASQNKHTWRWEGPHKPGVKDISSAMNASPALGLMVDEEGTATMGRSRGEYLDGSCPRTTLMLQVGQPAWQYLKPTCNNFMGYFLWMTCRTVPKLFHLWSVSSKSTTRAAKRMWHRLVLVSSSVLALRWDWSASTSCVAGQEMLCSMALGSQQIWLPTSQLQDQHQPLQRSHVCFCANTLSCPKDKAKSAKNANCLSKTDIALRILTGIRVCVSSLCA